MAKDRKRSEAAKKGAEARREHAEEAQQEAQKSQAEASTAQDEAVQALAQEGEEKETRRETTRETTREVEREGAQESQEESDKDSGLQTPQPDQPMPTETERREGGPRKDESDSPPRRQEDEQASDSPEQPEPPQEFVDHVVHGGRSFRADVLVDDQRAVEAQRQDELAEALEEHNRRISEVVEPEHRVFSSV